MDFWQVTALAGLVVAICIGASEFVQLALQRKILKQILAYLDMLDVDSALDRATENSNKLMGTVESVIRSEAGSFREQLSPKEIAAQIGNVIRDIDIKPIAEAVADVVLERAHEQIPELVQDVQSEVHEALPGMIPQLDPDMVKLWDKHPFGALLQIGQLAMMARQMKQQGAAPGGSSGNDAVRYR